MQAAATDKDAARVRISLVFAFCIANKVIRSQQMPQRIGAYAALPFVGGIRVCLHSMLCGRCTLCSSYANYRMSNGVLINKPVWPRGIDSRELRVSLFSFFCSPGAKADVKALLCYTLMQR